MRPRRLVIGLTCLGLLAATAGGCGTKAPAVTGLTVTVTFPTLTLDQVELAVNAGATQVVMPVRRPAQAGAMLASPQSVSIFLPDALAGQSVTCTATPFLGGAPVGPPSSADATLELHRLVPVEIVLQAGGDAGTETDAADAADATEDGGKDAADAKDGAGGDATGGGDVASDVPAGTPKANGVACGSSAECESTQCKDGVCCGSVCAGICESCNQKGSEGTCKPLPAGTPTTECVDQLAASCGFDGTCNGSGGCRRYAAGTPCKAASCQTDTFLPASACDGQGTCFTPNAVSCAPYLCDSSGGAPACRSTCQAGVVGCVAPAVCSNGSCGAKVLKADGAGCVVAGDCTSNHCVDGVCCATACTGACVACNQVGFGGTCRPVDAGKPDPHGVCKDAGAATCKQTGLCDGASACALYPATTTCLAGSCSGRMVIAVRHCDGAGTCLPGADVDCLPYRCDSTTTACFTSCSTNAQCSASPRKVCTNNVCQ